MKINYSSLAIGDRLVRTKGGYFSKHHAIYCGIDYRTGQQIVAENIVNAGVRIIALNKFISAGKLIRIEHLYLTKPQQQLVIKRINARIGRRYNLLTYNCEHFTNEVLYGRSVSPQIEKALTLGLGAVAVSLLIRNN